MPAPIPRLPYPGGYTTKHAVAALQRALEAVIGPDPDRIAEERRQELAFRRRVEELFPEEKSIFPQPYNPWEGWTRLPDGTRIGPSRVSSGTITED